MNLQDGVRLFEVEEWLAEEADLEIWSDASKDGLGFWVLKLSTIAILTLFIGHLLSDKMPQ